MSESIELILELIPGPENAAAVAAVHKQISDAQKAAVAASKAYLTEDRENAKKAYAEMRGDADKYFNARTTAAEAAAKKEAESAISLKKKEEKAIRDMAASNEREAKKDAAAAKSLNAQKEKALREAAAEAERQAKKAKALLKEQENDAKKAAAELKKIEDDKRKDAQKTAAAQVAAHAQYIGAVEQAEQANIRAWEAGAKMAKGSLDVAKSAAVLGLVSEENLEKFVKGYAVLTSVVEGVKGGIDAWSGAVDMMRNLQTATQAATAAQGALNAARATGAAAGATQAATSAAAGASGAAAAGGAGAAAGGAGATGAGGAVLGTAGFLALAVSGGIALYESVAFAARSMGIEMESAVGAVGGWIEALSEGAELKRKNDQKEAELQDIAIGRAETLQASVDTRLSLGARADALSYTGDEGFDTRQLRQRKRIEQGIAETGERYILSQGSTLLSDETKLKLREDAENRIKALRGDMLALDEQAAQYAQQRVVAAKSTLDIVQNQLGIESQIAAANDQQAFEADRLAAFGQLAPSQQQGLKEINQKIGAGGEITAQEAEFLKSTGFGQKQLNSYYEEQGMLAGGNEVVAGLEGGRARQEEQMARVSELREREATLMARHQTAIEDEEKARKRLIQAIEEEAKQRGVSLDPNNQRQANAQQLNPANNVVPLAIPVFPLYDGFGM